MCRRGISIDTIFATRASFSEGPLASCPQDDLVDERLAVSTSKKTRQRLRTVLETCRIQVFRFSGTNKFELSRIEIVQRRFWMVGQRPSSRRVRCVLAFLYSSQDTRFLCSTEIAILGLLLIGVLHAISRRACRGLRRVIPLFRWR